MIRKLGYYLSRPGYYLSVAYYDIPFRIFFCILTLKLLLFDYIIGLGTLSFSPDFGVIIIMLAFSLLIKNKLLKFTYLLALDAAFSLIFLSNSLYRSYFQDFTSAYCIYQVPLLIGVADSVVYLVKKEFLFIVDFIFLPLLFLLFSKLKNKCDFSIRDRVKAFCILLLLGLYCNLTVFSNIKAGINNFFNFNGERSIFVRYAGIINYQIFDAYCYLTTGTKKGQITQSDINSVKSWFKGDSDKRNTKNVFTAIGRGHNLIFIQVESLQNFVIGKRYNGKEITPNLNKLAKGGIYFNNIHDQTAAGGSSDATLLANSSLYPARKGAASYLYPQNCYDSLPKVLKKRGYTTAVMHPYVRSFWNSEIFEKTLGFERQFYQDGFVIDDVIGLGLSDQSFFAQSLEKIKGLPAPFYAFLRTLTAHFPYDYVTKDIDNFPLDDLEVKTTGHYLRTMHYVDSAIGEFLHKLFENNLASNTIIVVFGDHRARLPYDEMKQIGISDMNEDRKIPMIISLPNRKQRDKRDTIGGLIDIAPTICNILGIDTSDRFFMGKDLGDKNGGFAIFRDGSFISRENSIDRASAQQQLIISDLILEKDMIPLMRKDTHASD